jgi:hypothetical protein
MCKTSAGVRWSEARRTVRQSYFSLDRNDIEFYFDFVFDLNGFPRNADGIYAEVALLERCGTAIVSPVQRNYHNNGFDSFRAGLDCHAPPMGVPGFGYSGRTV